MHKHLGRILPAALGAATIAGAVGAAGASSTPATVTVPAISGSEVDTGYAALHRLGLRVSIPQPYALNSLSNPQDQITGITPRSGSTVVRGTTVTLTVGCPRCAVSSPGVPTTLPSYRVPDLVGDAASVAVAWVRSKALYLTQEFGALHRGDAATLPGNFRIVSQSPAAGSELKLGIGHRTGPSSGSFTPTPLIVRLAQRG